MQYAKDFDIMTFEFWSGAKTKVDTLDYDEKQALEEMINTVFDVDDYIPTDTEINDFVWFDVNYITYDTHGAPQCGCEVQFHMNDDFQYDDDFMARVENGYARIVEFQPKRVLITRRVKMTTLHLMMAS